MFYCIISNRENHLLFSRLTYKRTAIIKEKVRISSFRFLIVWYNIK
ncbi:hypothetical protein HMPREF3033_00845 [Veillonellaceae bacterium DNF00751]|nr:hypothetical protein HMPREF3033_00845 [Veillonellaceae bacterium DNF00751]